ncbi:MAG: hypothetical protein R3D98_06235 [Candidatus Krumholzibacteriia bacterium]
MPREPRDFQAQLLAWQEIHELPDGWPGNRLLALLVRLEVDGVAESEAADLALLALQDLAPDEAADRVLEVIFGDTMRGGVRRNLAHDLTGVRPWEEFADLSRQAGIFEAVVLLQKAFPRDYDRPDAVAVDLSLTTTSERGNAWLDAPTVDPALLARIIAAGLDPRATLLRLFSASLAGPRFPEAAWILWRVERQPGPGPDRRFRLVSSPQWFAPLQGLETWTAKAWPDELAPADQPS